MSRNDWVGTHYLSLRMKWNDISHSYKQLFRLCCTQLKEMTCEECNQAGATGR